MLQIIPLRSAWVMTAVFAPSGNFVACGGMDNMLTVYDINNRDASGAAKLVHEFCGYEGFLSSCRFLSDESVVTGSGDMKIMHWDVPNKTKIKSLDGHNGDIAALSLKVKDRIENLRQDSIVIFNNVAIFLKLKLQPDDNQVFLTGSVDRTIRLWDLRTDACQQTFWGHEADVNSLAFHPNGQNFVTCSEDKTSRLWDIRSDQEVTSQSWHLQFSGQKGQYLST